ncbi:MAG: hypothetical protein HY328_05365, partial [Chloroflexi bacterium]|nr:hypothetical protein [Chloroflexota bacterium]
RNQTLYFKYDDLNRTEEKRQTNATGALIADYTFDAAGQKGLLSKSRAYSGANTTEVQYVTYDALNRLTQQNWVVPTTSTGGGTFRFDYTYNEADQPTSTRYPLDHLGQQGEAVNYTYNSVGQISAVSSISGTYASSASYNPAGQLTQLAQPGLTRQRVYETNTLRLSVVKAGTTSPWDNRQNLTYTYDNAGNVASLVDGQNGTGQKQCFQYDYLYRLTAAFTGNSGCTVYSATGTGPYQHTYAYDAIGNLTSYTGNSYTYGSGKPHAVTAAFGNSYAYDGNGNQTTRTIGGTVYTLVYDYENRLTEVKQGTTVLASFVYDADGNRVKGTVGSTNTVYIAGLYEYSGGAAKSYYTGPGGVVAMRSGGTVYYLLSDHLNSTARIVNSAGTTQSTSYYYPFGGNRGGAFSSLTTRRFTGQYHESSIPGGEGLYFYNARWYDAKLGRFVSADTLVPSPGNPQSFNRYSYVYNNPLKYTDPSGHAGKDVGQCMCGGVGGGDVGGSSLISAILPIRWLIKSEMLPNAQSQVAIRIEHRNTEAAQLMADIGADDNEMASNLGLALQSKSEAYRLWISMVKAGADWDHKGEIREKYREYVQYEGYAYRFDTWSNIHYGFVGRKIGFTSTELLAGAGAAQIKDGTSNIRYWKSWFDEPEDQAGIRIGIEMYETYQLNLTPAQFRHVFDRNAALLSRWKIDIGEYGGGYGSGGDR